MNCFPSLMLSIYVWGQCRFIDFTMYMQKQQALILGFVLQHACVWICAGSILSAGGSGPFENAKTSDWAAMADTFQKAALQSRLGIPLLYGIDAVHGNNNVYGATIFPHNIGLGATRFSLCASSNTQASS